MIRRVAAVAAVLLAAALVAAVAFVYGPLPSRRGLIEIPGLSARVDVRFDRAGIPHVAAVLETDAWRALGWVHASERLFQMEMRRRAAAGRLAEVFGAPLVPLDIEARTWGHLRRAREDFAALPERERAVLEAYSGGVNAFLEDGILPHELRLLRVTPEPWTPLDTLAFGRLMYQGLTIADAQEAAVLADVRARGIDAAVATLDASDGVLSSIPPETRAALDHGGAKIVGPGLSRARKPLHRKDFERGPGLNSGEAESGISLSSDLAVAAAQIGSPGFGMLGRTNNLRTTMDRDEAAAGSNAWALSGTRTASGKPLLAGDPHLNAERPGVWYAAHLTTADGLSVAGLTLAGVPGVIIGHNGKVAWSIAMNQADDVDYVLEPVADVADSATETIRVASGQDVTVPSREGRHGPVVDELPGGIAVTRSWISARLRHGIGFHLDAARAKDGARLRDAWSSYLGPAINLCWADAGGSIGMAVVGAVPRRQLGDGRLPVPGWIDGYVADELIPPSELPSIVNPREGYVATANDDWSAARIALPYPGHFASTDRVLRARDLAGRLSKAEVADMRAMQADVYSPYAARVVAALRGLPLRSERAARARDALVAWDARVLRRGPSRLFFAFMKRLREGAADRDAAGTAGAWLTWSLLDRMVTGRTGPAAWDDPGTPAIETREGQVERALALALDDVEREGGKDPSRWSWGRVHRLAYPHPLAAGLAPLLARRLELGPVELPGEWHTLDVAGFRLRGDDYAVVHIPSARLVIDLGNPDASRLSLPLGQSGQVLDRHERDQLRRWSAVRDLPMPFTEKAVAAASVSTLSFVPRR